MTTPAPKQPADRKPKADAPFTFKAPGEDKNGKPITKTYTLPKVTEENAAKIPGGVTLDAIMKPDDQMAQLRLSLAQLDACEVPDATMKALRSLPTDQMMETIGEWLGESSGSSD